ncbi:MAG: site-specific DNA-methyltransferase [Vulcanimicrobiaceae bacterium]
MDIASPSPFDDTLGEIRALVPSAWKDGQLDFDALKEALGSPITTPDRFLFTWAGRAEAMRATQESTTNTLKPDRERSIDFDKASNLIVRGDNLEALKILYRSYFDSVKLVYIDPPYNTGNDFIYRDDFSTTRDAYLSQAGWADEDGNLTSTKAESSGRLHSAWLSMMYPRLMRAKALLRSDGVIAINISERELGNLLLLMNEVFGEENREAIVAWRRRHNQPNDPTKMIATVAEFIVVYAKNSAALKAKGAFYGLPLSEKRRAEYRNPDNDPRGAWDSKPWKAAIGQGGSDYVITSPTGNVLDETWLGAEETFEELSADKRIYWPKNGDGLPRKKFFLTERDETGQCAHNFWGHEAFGSNQEASAELAKIMGKDNLFDNPKPVKLIKALVSITCGKDDVVMDFFAGTGTTAQAVVELNAEDQGRRRFILVQIPEPVEDKKFSDIFDICVERVRRVCKMLDERFRTFEIAPSFFERWSAPQGEVDAEEYDARLALTMDGLRKGWTTDAVLAEISLKEGYGATPRVETLKLSSNTLYRVTSTETEKSFYACLDERIDKSTLTDLHEIADQTTLLVCRDIALDDSTATNLAFFCRLKVL